MTDPTAPRPRGRPRELNYDLEPVRTSVVTYRKVTRKLRDEGGPKVNVSEIARQAVERALAHPSLGMGRIVQERERLRAELDGARKLVKVLDKLRGRFAERERDAWGLGLRGGDVRPRQVRWARDAIEVEPLLKTCTPERLLEVLGGPAGDGRVPEMERRLAGLERELDGIRARVAADVRDLIASVLAKYRAWAGREPTPSELGVWLEGRDRLLEDYRLIAGAPRAAFSDFLDRVRAYLVETGPP